MRRRGEKGGETPISERLQCGVVTMRRGIQKQLAQGQECSVTPSMNMGPKREIQLESERGFARDGPHCHKASSEQQKRNGVLHMGKLVMKIALALLES